MGNAVASDFSHSITVVRDIVSAENHQYYDRIFFPDSGSTSSQPLWGLGGLNELFWNKKIDTEQFIKILKDQLAEADLRALPTILYFIRLSRIAKNFEELTGFTPWLCVDISRYSVKYPGKTGADSGFLPWHCDNRASYGYNIVTAWFADRATGFRTPGLSFYRFQQETDAANFFHSKNNPRSYFSDEELVQNGVRGEIVTPIRQQYDAILFGRNVIHKTQDTITRWEKRRSFELRLSNPYMWHLVDTKYKRISLLARLSEKSDKEIEFFITFLGKIVRIPLS